MTISAQLVQELRGKTGAGMMDCKKALADAEGDLDKAIELLRKRGLSAAAKKEGRVASEGLVESYIHAGGKIGVLVEVNCETDFVARNEDFQRFVRDIAMHVAASSPECVRRDEVAPERVAKEKEIIAAQLDSNKPAEILEKIISGRLDKFYQEICLLEQPFVKEPKMSVEEYQTEMIAKIGEKISIRRFVRFKLGEGIEKRTDDFAAEVQKVASGQ